MISTGRGMAIFEWINRRVWRLAAALLVVGVALSLLYPAVADDGEPTFDPGGGIYDTFDRVDTLFETSSSTRSAVYLVENPAGGDVLSQAALAELKRNQDAVRADPESQRHLVPAFDPEFGIPTDGIFSIADAIDEALPGGLAVATDAEVKVALAELLADDAPTSSLRFLLATTGTTRDVEQIDGADVVVWRTPAFFTKVLYDIDSFDTPTTESFGDESNLDAERWLRDVQVLLRGDQEAVTAIGVTIDIGLVSEEQFAVAGPFIFAAVAFILIFAGALLRSYWAAMLVGAGLGVVMMFYNGLLALLQIKTNSPLLILVVPIALISFGVDFFVHASGRAREKQVAGLSRERAYPIGLTAVFTALLLAAMSSIAAFVSNTVSGIQAIIEFGLAAAIGLLLCYLILGWLTPKLLLAVEERLGPRPANQPHLRTVGHKVGFTVAAFVGGIAVTAVIVLPAYGWAVLLTFLGLFLALPLRLTRRRNERAARAGRPLTDEVKGAGHGFAAAGTVVHFLARWRVFTIPAVAVFAAFGLWGASQVESGFEIKDFFSSDTDFVRSIDRVEDYFELAAAVDYILVEGDLTSPDVLSEMRAAVADLAASSAPFVRDFNGKLEVGRNAVSIVEFATAIPEVRAAVQSASGVAITDDDGDGLADMPEQVAAIYDYASGNDLVVGGAAVYRADQTEEILFVGPEGQATRIDVVIPSISDDAIILAGRAQLEATAADLRTATAGLGVTSVAVSGGAIITQDTLDAFTGSMLVSLPVAIVLTSLLVFGAVVVVLRRYGRQWASVLKRSARYSLVSMVPILLVVAWVYGFMYLAGFRINMVTATIAAIAVGVGIDYATHFTVRFIEEFETGEPSRFPALRRAGEGTGGALTISALTSMTGFLVMAAAPMPMFQTFGILMAVMIAFALLVSLLVLPSLLLLITPSRKGEERAHLIERLTGGDADYEPHARQPVTHGGP